MRRTLSMIAGIGLGLGFSQYPEFAQQYEQRLGGAVDELRIITQTFDTAAQAAGLSREEALDTYEQVDDTFLAGQGIDMARNFDRYDRLSSHLTAIENANPIERLVNLGAYYDNQIAERALEAYDPAVPVGVEGFAFAGAGVVAGYGLFTALLALFGRLLRLLKRRGV